MLSLSSTLNWGADWRLSPKTTYSVDFQEPCRVTKFNYDATSYVRGVVKRVLDNVVSKMDHTVSEATNMKPNAEALWRRLVQPIPVAPRTWVMLRPESAMMSPLRSGPDFNTTIKITLTTSPTVVFGDQPTATETPLPNLTMGDSSGRFHLFIDGKASFSEIEERLRPLIIGKEIANQDGGKSRLRVNQLTVSAVNGHPIFRVNVSGRLGGWHFWDSCDGDVLLTGRVRYEQMSRTIIIDRVDYTPETKNALVNGVDLVLHERLRRQIEEALKFSIGAQLDSMQHDFQAALNRDLSPGVKLSASLDSFALQGVLTTPEGVLARMEATGEARLTVGPDFVASVTLPPPVQCGMPDACQTCYVDVWEDENFGGGHDRLCGPMDAENMRDLANAERGDWGDSIESIKLGSAAYLAAYEDENFADNLRLFYPSSEHRNLKGPPDLSNTIDSIKLSCGRPSPIVPPSAECGSCYIDVWEDPDFKGSHDRICGPLIWPSMRFIPNVSKKDWGDKIDSIKVGSGAWVTVWEDENYRDTQQMYGPETVKGNLKGPPDMGDNIGSIRIECKKPSYWPEPSLCAGCYVQVYEDSDFRGDTDKLCGPLRVPNMRGLPGAKKRDWGDKIDSLKVGPKARVKVWEDENFEDSTRTFEPNSSPAQLGDMGDNIDSIQIDCL
ncbi:MAG: DUF4403 family protein [Polyangia bacterium]